MEGGGGVKTLVWTQISLVLNTFHKLKCISRKLFCHVWMRRGLTQTTSQVSRLKSDDHRVINNITAHSHKHVYKSRDRTGYVAFLLQTRCTIPWIQPPMNKTQQSCG